MTHTTAKDELKQRDFCDSWQDHQWRIVECNGDKDIKQCDRCGERREIRCTFDEDYA
jgi:hypothetical protein